MNRTVKVALGARSYEIRIGTDIPVFGNLADARGVRVLVVSDTNVDPLYGDRTETALCEAGVTVTRAVVPAGEATKGQEHVFALYDQALAAGLDRGGIIVALGGGVVGDLAGFVAATFLRGIRYIQVPTTLLAMVDSSVGGKTGINLPQGKNLVGAFHQPAEVVVDLSTLTTLPDREYISGLAEVVKHGVIRDAAFFERLEANTERVADRDPEFLAEVVARCCEIKAEVVAADEKECGLRAILNFGHTLAHALESLLGYGRLLHGEAVGIGMNYAAKVSERELGFPSGQAERLETVLGQWGLPYDCTSMPDLKAAVAPPDWAAIWAKMATDKKVRCGAPRFVLAEALGTAVFGCEVAEETLAEVWREMTA